MWFYFTVKVKSMELLVSNGIVLKIEIISHFKTPWVITNGKIRRSQWLISNFLMEVTGRTDSDAPIINGCIRLQKNSHLVVEMKSMEKVSSDRLSKLKHIYWKIININWAWKSEQFHFMPTGDQCLAHWSPAAEPRFPDPLSAYELLENNRLDEESNTWRWGESNEADSNRSDPLILLPRGIRPTDESDRWIMDVCDRKRPTTKASTIPRTCFLRVLKCSGFWLVKKIGLQQWWEPSTVVSQPAHG